MNEKRITRKQFLKAVVAAPALKLIGAGGDFHEIDYERGGLIYRWVDNAGREVWLFPNYAMALRAQILLDGDVVIVNGDYAFVYRETEDAWHHTRTITKDWFHIMMGVWDNESWDRWERGG